jgi:hypothetical protein
MSISIPHARAGGKAYIDRPGSPPGTSSGTFASEELRIHVVSCVRKLPHRPLEDDIVATLQWPRCLSCGVRRSDEPMIAVLCSQRAGEVARWPSKGRRCFDLRL